MSENIHENLHERARQLISQERIEGIPGSENTWLASHLQECESCANFARNTSAALRSLQTIPIALPTGLAERTLKPPGSGCQSAVVDPVRTFDDGCAGRRELVGFQEMRPYGSARPQPRQTAGSAVPAYAESKAGRGSSPQRTHSG